MSIQPNQKRKAWLSASPAPGGGSSAMQGKPNMDAKRPRMGMHHHNQRPTPLAREADG